jgi:alpha-beta hydrolase superfamily lysophospholipase
MAGLPSVRRRAWYHPWRLLPRIVLYLALLFLGCSALLYFKQTALIYPAARIVPPDEVARSIKDAGLVPWTDLQPDAKPGIGLVPPNFRDPAPRGTVVLFHGNGELAYDSPEVIPAFHQRGFRPFFYEYPGYGGRPGLPSELIIVPDARALVRSLDAAGLGPVYVWGMSIGSGVAAAVCADSTVPVHGCVLLAPFDSLRNVAAFYYPYFPVRLLMIDRYDSVTNLQHFGRPVCVVRGAHDDVIPPALAMNLFRQLPEPKKEIVFPDAGHGGWPTDPRQAWWDQVLDFIAPKAPGSP